MSHEVVSHSWNRYLRNRMRERVLRTRDLCGKLDVAGPSDILFFEHMMSVPLSSSVPISEATELAEPDALVRLTAPFVKVLVDDGIHEERAYQTVFETLVPAAELFEGGCNTQARTLDRVNAEGDNRSSYFGANSLELLPGLVALAPFSFNAGGWVASLMGEGAARSPDEYFRSSRRKNVVLAMRYFDLWKSMPAPDLQATIDSLFENWGQGYVLAQKFDKIASGVPEEDYLNGLVARLVGVNEALPLLSYLEDGARTATMNATLSELVSLGDGPVITTDAVVPTKRLVVNYPIGRCPEIECGHGATFFGEEYTGSYEEKLLGRPAENAFVLLRVDGEVIGSMKMFHSHSILGLRTLRDSEGRFPMVTGGVYYTSDEIVAQAQAAYDRAHASGSSPAILDIEGKLPLVPLRFMGSGARTGSLRCTREYVGRIPSLLTGYTD